MVEAVWWLRLSGDTLNITFPRSSVSSQQPNSRNYCSERLRLEVGAVWLKPHVLQAGNDKRIELANLVSQAVEVD